MSKARDLGNLLDTDGDVVSSSLDNVDLSKLEYNQAILAFKIASSNQLAKFSMVDQVIDEYQDDTGIDAGNSTNELTGGSGTAKYYQGGTAGVLTTVTKSYTGSNQTWVVPFGVETFTFKAWGAGGAGWIAGGGGGFIESTITASAGETLNIKVGGTGTFISGVPSCQGGGGGGTGIYRSSTVLAVAGGGGGGSNNAAGGAGGGTTGGSSGASGSTYNISTGGTQSASGSVGTGATAGGLGFAAEIPTGSAADTDGGYNGGGGGGGDNANWTGTGGGGGYYGGGSGGTSASTYAGGGGGSSLSNGTNTQASGSTGAGQADADYPGSVGDGGYHAVGEHGAAVLKYTPSVVDNITLQSEATTAESAPTTADLVVLIEDGAGTATLNTDIKGYISRNGSAFSSAVTFVDEGDWGTNKRILVARNVDISGITSGTSMKYKLTTHNQVASSLETRIHATSLAWA